MKVGFFLLKFPLSSETFVLNQITAFIDMGYDVEIIALQKGDTKNTHAAYAQYGLEAKTRWLQDEPSGRLSKLRHRASHVDVAGSECFPLWFRIPQSDPLGHLRANRAAVSCRRVYRPLWPGGRHRRQAARAGRD